MTAAAKNIFTAALLAAAAARAQETNLITTNDTPLTREQRRARVEAWRAQHSSLTNTPATNFTFDPHLTREERRNRVRENLARARDLRDGTATNPPPPAPPAPNP